MSRRNCNTPKFSKPSVELLKNAKKLVESWREGLEPYRKENCYYSGIDDNAPIPVNSVTNAICAWIERNSDWEFRWKSVLQRIPKSVFLQTGYKGFQPNLHWMFFGTKVGGLGINRVLGGYYDQYTRKSGMFWSPDEGV